MSALSESNPLISHKVKRSHSIVDDGKYRRERRQPLVPRFQRRADGGYAYDPAAAHICAVASGWSYASADTLRAAVKDLMEVDLECFEFSASNPAMYLDTNAFFLKTTEPDLCPNTGILVFRGTEVTSVGDFLADAYVEMQPFPREGDTQGSVHAGFSQGARAVWKRVYNMLIENPVEHLLITGHSLGGAMAVMTAARIIFEHERGEDERFKGVVRSLSGLYTYGQPAVGDAGFARWAEQRLGPMTFRHAYANDVVPFLPTSDINQSYQHYRSGVWTCERDDLTWTGPNEGREFLVAKYFGAAIGLALADFVGRRFPFRVRPIRKWLEGAVRYSLDDHSPLNYIRVSEASQRASAGAEVSVAPERESHIASLAASAE